MSSNYGDLEVKLLAEITRIVNEPGMTWKNRRALLWHIGVSDELARELVKEDDPADY